MQSFANYYFLIQSTVCKIFALYLFLVKKKIFFSSSLVTPTKMDRVPEMRELQQNLAKVISWKDLGLQLDVEYEELQKIEHKYRQDIEDCKKEMLNLWLKRKGKDATRRNIIEALKSINEHVVADRYITLVKQRDTSTNSQLNG